MTDLNGGAQSPSKLRVVILTSPGTDRDMADTLAEVPCVELVAVFVAPLPKARGWRRRLRNALRYHGIVGMTELKLSFLSRSVWAECW